MSDRKRNGGLVFRGYPLAVLTLYGPAADRATRLSVCIFTTGSECPASREWTTTESDIRFDTTVAHEVSVFLGKHRVRSMMLNDEIAGCPGKQEQDVSAPALLPEGPLSKTSSWKPPVAVRRPFVN